MRSLLIFTLRNCIYIVIAFSILAKVDKDSPEHNVYHYLTEAAKFAASYRMNLGDPDDNNTADVVRQC